MSDEVALYECLAVMIGETNPFMFLELAILMNIAKWTYFILAVKAHRNIRHFEISVDIFAEREGLYSVIDAATEEVENTV